jgi:hypothetical protein
LLKIFEETEELAGVRDDFRNWVVSHAA